MVAMNGQTKGDRPDNASAGSSTLAELGANPGFGEGFQQEDVRKPAVEDVRGADAGIERLEAGFELGDHAPAHRAGSEQAPGLVLLVHLMKGAQKKKINGATKKRGGRV